MEIATMFQSFFVGGFECSSHRRHDGVRLDLLAATRHDAFVERDYASLARHGIRTVRDGIRWHLVEGTPGRFDWSSVLPMLRAAQCCNTQVVWDLCHYGVPDDVDVWTSAFVDRLARFAAAFAHLIADETDQLFACCPVNEMSYWAWAGGDTGRIGPCSEGRGMELKRQLVRGTIASIEAIRNINPGARFITAEPLIHVDAGALPSDEASAASNYHNSQFEATDMLTGRLAPELGGHMRYLDLVGLNYYPANQWYWGGSTIPLGHHAYVPLSTLLTSAHARYGRPLFLAETGAEGSARGAWLHYVCDEVRRARHSGVPVEGVCLYPVVDYPGWENGRHCAVGLLSQADERGLRSACSITASELARQQELDSYFSQPTAKSVASWG